LVKLNFVPSDDKLRLRGNALRQAIAKDKENGLIPFYVSEIIIEFRCLFLQLEVLALCNIGYNWSLCF
jgi:histidine decarboxylase